MTLDALNPESLGRPRGWSHGMLAGPGDRVLFLAGMTAPEGDFLAQWDGALVKVLAVLAEAGVGPEAVARMTVYVRDMAVYRASLEALGEVWRKRMGRHYPALALVQVSDFVDPRALVEIEATAVVPG